MQNLVLLGLVWHIQRLPNPCFNTFYCVCMLDCRHGQEHEAIVITGLQLSPWTVNLMIRAVISSPMHTQSWDRMETNLHRGVDVGLQLGLVQLIRQLGGCRVSQPLLPLHSTSVGGDRAPLLSGKPGPWSYKEVTFQPPSLQKCFNDTKEIWTMF